MIRRRDFGLEDHEVIAHGLIVSYGSSYGIRWTELSLVAKLVKPVSIPK